MKFVAIIYCFLLFSSFSNNLLNFVGSLFGFILSLFIPVILWITLHLFYSQFLLSISMIAVFMVLNYYFYLPNLALKPFKIYFPFFCKTALLPFIVLINRLRNSPFSSQILLFSIYSYRVFAPNSEIWLLIDNIWLEISSKR